MCIIVSELTLELRPEDFELVGFLTDGLLILFMNFRMVRRHEGQVGGRYLYSRRDATEYAS